MTQAINYTTSTPPPGSAERKPNLFGRLKRALRPPVFINDEVKTRKAALLNSILLTALVISALYTISIIFTSVNPLLGFSITTVLQGTLIYSLIAIRQGHVEFVGYFMTSLIWLYVAISNALFGNIVNPILPSFIIVIFVAGIVIDNRAAAVFAGLSILTGAIIYMLSVNGLLPEVLTYNSIGFLVRISLNFVLIAVLIYLSNQLITQALSKASAAQEALTRSNQELSEIKTYLEGTVEERNEQLERRNRYLEAAAQVARKTIAITNMQEMLNAISMEISNLFSYYHVGIFLLDEKSEWAMLRAASSDGGKQMIARNHRLEVGKQGIVGFVTSIGKARISQDVEMDRIHSVTQELPDTRSEMALPLIARNKVIGALDIQDSMANAFSQEDIALLQTMADQIALALENIRLYQSAQDSLEEVQRVYGLYSERAWAETYRKNLLTSYRYAGGTLEEIARDQEPSLLENKVSIPIKVRGFNIGAIEITKEESEFNEWTDDELKLLNSLSEQLGIALDSARLFNETQLRATTEHMIGEINTTLWETLDINSILKTSARKIQQALELPEVTIRMTPPVTESANGHDQETGETE